MLKTLINRVLSNFDVMVVRASTIDRLLAAEAGRLTFHQKPDGQTADQSPMVSAREILEEIAQNRLRAGQAVHATFKDINIAAQFNAAASSAQWLYANADRVALHAHRTDLLLAILPMVPPDGDLAEFGVFTGAVTRFVRPRFTDRTYHAFDSFRGVPEAMSLAIAKHSFDLEGVIPDLPPNTTIHAGWFEQTVPAWHARHSAPIAFAYIDCDIYDSVRTVLDGIADRVRPGSILAFDDWYNFPNWQAHSLRAAQEFQEKYGIRLEPIGFCTLEHAGAFRVVA